MPSRGCLLGAPASTPLENKWHDPAASAIAEKNLALAGLGGHGARSLPWDPVRGSGAGACSALRRTTELRIVRRASQREPAQLYGFLFRAPGGSVAGSLLRSVRRKGGAFSLPTTPPITRRCHDPPARNLHGTKREDPSR